MIRFNCDYSEGAAPQILERLAATNLDQTPGYGEDDYCRQAARLILDQVQNPAAQVHFLVGGTQTNLTVIAAALRPHQCVLSADTGHVNVHETGAIEACGHKVVTLPTQDGKITAASIRDAVEGHYGDVTHEHITQPKLVYISCPTELGTLYSRRELEEISGVCREKGLYLFVDGARLGYGLASPASDLTLADLGRLCDAFYIGGTKQGALFGEAVVLLHPALQEDFRYLMKQKGAMLAKGRLLGIQFLVLFENGLYWELAAHADRLALRLRDRLAAKGISFLLDSPTNQQFPILPNRVLDALSDRYAWSFWAPAGEGYSAVRFCTSWATREEDVDALIRDLEEALG